MLSMAAPPSQPEFYPLGITAGLTPFLSPHSSRQESRCPWPPPIKFSLSSAPKAKYQPEGSILSTKVCRVWTLEGQMSSQ